VLTTDAVGDVVVLKGITKRFGDNLALDDVAVTLARGEVHALVGENGAGKSTLMKVLAGHLAADAGTLTFDGVALSTEQTGPRAGVGFVEQEGGLIRELTGAENLILAEQSGFIADRRSASARIRELGRRFGGEVNPDVPVESLAVGQRQRLEIMIVLARGSTSRPLPWASRTPRC
jgi:ABC-type uncharacterized transport system ATPase subunit